MGLNDRVAVVTGSTRGIGLGIARRLADEGARVVVNGRHQEDTERVASDLQKRGARTLAVSADVGKATDVDRLFDSALEAFGRIDIVVNNAAMARPRCHFLLMDDEMWQSVLQTNLTSVYLCCHRAARIMVRSQRPGSIVNISSFSAVRAHRQQAAYDAAKGGIEAFTRAIALDLAPFGIRANVVGPGAIHVEEHERLGDEARRHRGAFVPLGRVGTAEEVASAVAFLASDQASYITGQCLYVDGGALAQLRSPQDDLPLPDSVAALVWRPSGGDASSLVTAQLEHPRARSVSKRNRRTSGDTR